MSSRKNNHGSNISDYLNEDKKDILNDVFTAQVNTPPLIQLHDELWIWDYTDTNKHLPGFGVLIAYKNGKTEVLHFNDQWDGKVKYRPNSRQDDFMPSIFKRQDLVTGISDCFGSYVFMLEIKD